MTLAIAALPPAAAGVAAAIHAQSADAPWPAETMAGLLVQPGVFGLVATKDAAPCGFILCRVAADEAEVLALGVLPDARRRGVGRALMAAATAAMACKGSARVLLEVSVRNTAALSLYRAIGFEEVGRRKAYYADHDGGGAVDALVMAMDLPPR